MAVRLDIYVKEQLNISRQKASQLIKLSNVKVNNKTVLKSSFPVTGNDRVDIINTDNVLKYVSRGGYKLEKAIEYFKIDLKDKVCIDIGASTGGFTDCMLQYGASKVYACDVGNNQLDDKLRSDFRVISIENMDIRNITLTEKADFISCDVSFISIKYIIEKVKELMKEKGSGVLLIKPQFEAGREYINKNGLVKNPKVHKKVLRDIERLLNNNGLYIQNISYSPIKGGDGNIEYIIYISNSVNNSPLPVDFTVDEAFNKL